MTRSRAIVGIKAFAVQGHKGDDWAMYVGPLSWSDDDVLSHGSKLRSTTAAQLVNEVKYSVDSGFQPFVHMEYRP